MADKAKPQTVRDLIEFNLKDGISMIPIEKRLPHALYQFIDAKIAMAALTAWKNGHHETDKALRKLRDDLLGEPDSEFKNLEEPWPEGVLVTGTNGRWHLDGIMGDATAIVLGQGFEFEVLVGDRWIKTSAQPSGAFTQDIATTPGIRFYAGQPARFCRKLYGGK